ncbi:MAG: ABC transporter permease [SAR202 cluster bacterium]|nr:ABC transporter permease [SAR202 cluster bacterium]
MGGPVPARQHVFRLAEGTDPERFARAIEAGLIENGVQAISVPQEVREDAGSSRMMDTLLQGFMGLGLIVGIAALGVIAARSVVERRQQIGVLRAIGFQKGMVQLTFLLEASFVALMGVAMGVTLGVLLAFNMISELSKEIAGLTFQMPWSTIAVLVVITFGASLLTTFLPARQAARVYPAEALRSE